MFSQKRNGWWILLAVIHLGASHVAQAAADVWQDVVSFRLPDDPVTRMRVTRAAEWLRRHTVWIERPGDKEATPVIAWRDPTLDPENSALLAGYVITDTLWAAKALKPIDENASREMEEGIRRLGWYGNGLHDVLFHPLDKIMHRPGDEDIVHGHSLGRFPIADGRIVDLRVFSQQWDAAFDVGHPMLFAEHAVYRGLHDFWQGRKKEARLRIRETIEDRRATDPQDQIFWDDRTGTIVDYVNRNDWLAFSRGEQPQCRHYTFKLGVLVYAIHVMGMEDEVPVARMKERLWSSQLKSGGMAHFVDLRRNGTTTPGRDATGEASAIAILVETVEPPKP
jgi:hypothetical protein